MQSAVSFSTCGYKGPTMKGTELSYDLLFKESLTLSDSRVSRSRSVTLNPFHDCKTSTGQWIDSDSFLVDSLSALSSQTKIPQ